MYKTLVVVCPIAIQSSICPLHCYQPSRSFAKKKKKKKNRHMETRLERVISAGKSVAASFHVITEYRVVKLGKTNLYGFLRGRLAINFTCYRVKDKKNFPLVSRTELV